MMNDEKKQEARKRRRAEKTICNTIWQFLVFLARIFKYRSGKRLQKGITDTKKWL